MAELCVRARPPSMEISPIASPNSEELGHLSTQHQPVQARTSLSRCLLRQTTSLPTDLLAPETCHPLHDCRPSCPWTQPWQLHSRKSQVLPTVQRATSHCHRTLRHLEAHHGA